MCVCVGELISLIISNERELFQRTLFSLFFLCFVRSLVRSIAVCLLPLQVTPVGREQVLSGERSEKLNNKPCHAHTHTARTQKRHIMSAESGVNKKFGAEFSRSFAKPASYKILRRMRKVLPLPASRQKNNIRELKPVCAW